MLDHVGLRTKKIKEMTSFYDAVLAPLGYSRLKDYGVAAGYGRDGHLPLWIGESSNTTSAIHLALSAADRAAVDAFYKVALENGAQDNGAPGLRAQYHADYYGAFIIDPDGNNVEAVCHSPE